MAVKPWRLAAFCVQLDPQIPSIIQQLDAGEGRTEANLEGTPVPRVAQSGAEAFGGVAEKSDPRNPSERAAFPQDEVGMEMADDGLLDLGQSRANSLLAPEKR